MTQQEGSNKSKFRIWLARVGCLGFLFFLLKGLAWIAFAYFVSA